MVYVVVLRSYNENFPLCFRATLQFILLQLQEKIGFLGIENRVCVAMSRAKKGLFCIGDFEVRASPNAKIFAIAKSRTDALLAN